MYRNAYQRGFFTVFFSGGSKPLDMWEIHTENGYISRFLDPDLKAMVLDIRGINVSTTYVLCPSNNRVLGITMPFMILVVKNLKKYFTFEVTILDDTGTRRRFRVSNFQSTTQIMPLSTVMPIGLADGWNQIQFNLSEFTRRAYNKAFVEVHKIKINANIRLRRIYFAEKLVPEEELPPEYRIFLPLPSKIGKGMKTMLNDASQTTLIKAASKAAVASKTNLKTASATSIVDIPQEAPRRKAGSSGGEEAWGEAVEAAPLESEFAPAIRQAIPEVDEASSTAGATESEPATERTPIAEEQLTEEAIQEAQQPTDETPVDGQTD